ncbi:MAG: hypothetical protein IJ489_00575 [Clostridia bacterium]|nr:hypothetical protein [Clostridia bacterium]
MGKHSRHNKEDRRAIICGHLYRHAILIVPLIMVLIILIFDKLFQIKNAGDIMLLFMGISFIFFGCYDIIGTILEWKHILVSMQIFSHSRDAINPRRSWTMYEKKQMIGSGIVLIVSGLAVIVLTVLMLWGVL